MQELGYNGKNFVLPEFNLSLSPIRLVPNASAAAELVVPTDSLVIRDLNQVYDYRRFLEPRRPVSLGCLTPRERVNFSTAGAPRVLDLPIKFPGSDVRLPQELRQFWPVVQRILDYEWRINQDCFHEYYAYLTIDQRMVRAGTLQREAPCHVDGFQGARWNPKVRCNHTYTVSDCLPTVYYLQPFDFSSLDPARHNFFWAMNRQVAMTKSAHAWRPQPFELTLMDGYSVHRGDESTEDLVRTWLRLSFEVRIFDRLGNAHNPHFSYDWPMVKRDIEGLGLVEFDPTVHPSLRVFPWQAEDGLPNPAGVKTKPRLT